MTELPRIIQGGMGAGVSSWQLARSVAAHGQMGVVSGTALDMIMARRLQVGDLDGDVRRALAAFPDARMVQDILDRYFVSDGKPQDQSFVAKPMVGARQSRRVQELLVVANFVEVFLAKEGHDGMVGINFLHKIQAPLLPSLYGAMLAGVDVVIVGAGIPLDIPQVIANLLRGESVELKLHVKDAPSDHLHRLAFDPAELFGSQLPELRAPRFIPIVSSAALATLMARKCRGHIDGLIVERASAGGHNAPPRGVLQLNPKGEPTYGTRDDIDLAAIHALGLPFWIAGSCGSPEELLHATAIGAQGVQVGTLFAFCDESGLREDLKREGIRTRDNAEVFTDPLASPTGFPFKVLSLSGTMSSPDSYAQRCRRCDMGYLREAYQKTDGTLGWRCAAEDPDDYVRKGGSLEDTTGRKCLCNGLLANIGLQQARRDGREELALVTCGDNLSGIEKVMGAGRSSYSATEVIDFLLHS